MNEGQLNALARVLNHVEGRFDIHPTQVAADVSLLSRYWQDNYRKVG